MRKASIIITILQEVHTLMKKLLCALLLASVFFAGAASADSHNVGLLTQLNMTQAEFQTYMDAALSSGLWTLFTAEDSNPAFFVFYDSIVAMQLGLDKGEVDEIDLPEAVGEYMLNTNPNYSIAAIAITKPIYFAFGFREKDGANLRDKFNTALQAMKADKTLAVLQMEYVVNPGTGPLEAVKFSKFEGADTIKVAVTGDLPPIDYVAADGTPAGFNTAILAEIGKRLKVNIELLNIESGARASALASGRADVVFWFQVRTGEGVQPDVPSGVILSESYYDWTKYLHIRKKAAK